MTKYINLCLLGHGDLGIGFFADLFDDLALFANNTAAVAILCHDLQYYLTAQHTHTFTIQP